MSTPSQDQLNEAFKVEIVDKAGQKQRLGDLIKGKKAALLFIRHFWCGNCQAYIKQLHSVIPPSSLGTNTTILVISCGSSSPIQAYIDLTQTPYPVYGNPSLELYKIFGFTSTLAGSKPGEEKEYEKDLGGMFSRTWQSVKDGPMKNIGHVNAVGPKSQNGGEVVLDADGSVLLFHRMAHTADHAELKEIARALGVESGSASPTEAASCDAGVKV